MVDISKSLLTSLYQGRNKYASPLIKGDTRRERDLLKKIKINLL